MKVPLREGRNPNKKQEQIERDYTGKTGKLIREDGQETG